MRLTSLQIGFFFLILLSGVVLCANSSATHHRPSASERVMAVLEQIESSLTETKYQHLTRVNKHKGRYFFDCSGMAAWVLKRSAPAALKSVGRPNDRRPLAVHFYRKIAKIPLGKKRGAWYRVPSAAHIQPGDIIAWKRPAWFQSSSTGHVAFAVGLPKNNNGEVDGILVRVADSSKFKHEDDSRSVGTTGYGTGVLLLPTERRGHPLGYGWLGSKTKKDWVIPAELVIGRPLR